MNDEVLVIGPVAWNHTVFLSSLPRPESHTVRAVRHHRGLGGTSAGKVLNLRAAGVGVTVRTVVGEDAEAGKILEALADAHVHVLAEVGISGVTEQHLNLMDPDGRRVSVYLETTGDVVVAPRHTAAVGKAMADAAAVVIDLSDAGRPFLAEAAEAGLPVWCDVHDYDGSAPWHRDFVEAADHLFCNDDALEDPEMFMRQRIAAGTRVVVVTRGADGALAMAQDGRLRQVAAAAVTEVVDTNGAGDAFFAGYLAAHLDGAGIDECLQRAADHAARCVASIGLAPAGAQLSVRSELTT